MTLAPQSGKQRFRFGMSLLAGGLVALGGPAIAQADNLCSDPALERVQTHQVTAGETIESLANQYGLLPATIRLMNPTLGNLFPGQTVRIPPFNGLEVTVLAGSTWQSLASTYQVRADVLFEINGCPTTIPRQVFIPGINGLPGSPAVSPATDVADRDPLNGYPLVEVADLLVAFGWQPHPEEDRLVFNSGVVLAATPREAVLAAGSGTVAYADIHETLGLLVVINHEQGLQTRYANLAELQVEAGDRVATGDVIATILGDPIDEIPSSLYFEVRSNSDLGWVARNPGDYIPALVVR
jgi:murein DD-endopeptidase MepM/ murein hydrolase activator NlpD